MTVVTQLVASAMLDDGTILPCTGIRIVMDDAWSPYVQAEFTVPYSVELAAKLDPDVTPAPRVGIYAERYTHGSLTLDDLSILYDGLTLDDLSVEWAGLTLADLSQLFATQWSTPFPPESPESLDVRRLVVRRRRIDYETGKMAVSVASEEAVAQDAREAIERPQETAEQRVTACLRMAGIELGTPGFTGLTGVVPAASIPWSTSLYEAAASAARTFGYRLTVDEVGTWVATQPATYDPFAALPLRRMSEAEDDTDRDQGYADVLVLLSKGITPAGAALSRTDIFPAVLPARPRRVVTQEVDHGIIAALPVPTSDELAARFAALRAQTRTLTFLAPYDFTLRPGQSRDVTLLPGLPELRGVVSRCEWDCENATMRVMMRWTEDTPYAY